MKSLTITDSGEKTSIPQAEHDVLSFWDDTHAFETSISSRPEGKRYVFYDGPPFATGLPHYGHILASTIKDVIPRYFTMKGYRVDRVWGWDCHGIPIENIVEKELGLKGGKKGIEGLGIDTFNDACRSAILRFDTEWEKVIRRIGRWVDFKHSYKTMDKTYMESVWWAFKSLWDKGFVYEGRKVILYCPRCATPLSNFEIAMDNSYKDVDEPSTTYKFKVVGEKDTYLLAWSTTPWNKLVTTGLAVNPNLTYVYVKQGTETYIVVETRISILNDAPYEIVKKVTGSDLHGIIYEPLYDFYPNRTKDEQAFIVVVDDYVTASEGTGIVTLAVYGEEDYRVMKKHHIQLAEHVDSEGKLKKEVTPWAGMYILKANSLIDEDLMKRGLIYKEEHVLHNVPTCYRCETRLYYAPIPAWFIDVQKMKTDLIRQNKNINWYPGYLKEGRFGKGLEQAPDWNISRSRYWGTPMPVWIHENSDKTVITRIVGSLEELQKWAINPLQVAGLTDIHREFLDDIEVWVDDKKTIKGKRIPEVFDCWVESGSMPYASIHYPFENKTEFESTHPAQFISEYIAQTRAWFYTLHVMSVGLFGSHTFENAVTSGTILAEDGTKMSKSKNNFPDPSLVFEKYGVDALRFYLMGSVVMKAENINFSENGVKEVYQKIINILWNVFSFYYMYKETGEEIVEPKPTHILDRWMVSKTNMLIRDGTNAFDGYDTVLACRKISEYIDALSTWYLRRSRDRIRQDKNARSCCGWMLRELVKVMAPITPFITERIYQNLVSGTVSIHLASWPSYAASAIDEDLEKAMTDVRAVVEKIHAKRKELMIPVRQPLRTATITGTSMHFSEDLIDVIKEETNIKTVVFETTKQDTNDICVVLDTALTPELIEEGKMRELIRKIQVLRKERACAVSDEINVQVPEIYKGLSQTLLEKIKKETVAKDIIWGETLDITIVSQS
ncbi:MAG: isoleucine--tRNA ligase [Candidatus Gottesmanbacteria bacterium]